MAGLSRRQFLNGAAVATAGSALTILGGASTAFAAEAATEEKTETKDTATEGSHISTVGTGMGKHGNVKVEVVTDGNDIERLAVIESRETSSLGEPAMSQLEKLILDNQTLNVDMVTGATLSSMAYLTAIEDALKQQGIDVDEWKERDAAQFELPELESSYDVIVIGGGGAGYTAAISAANKGQSVLLMEKLGTTGGSTALSGGEMAVPNNWLQMNSEDDIEDSPEQLVKDMLEGGDNLGDPELVEVIANGTKDASEWLTYEAGVSWEPDLLFFGGHSVKRSIIPTGHTGATMIVALDNRADSIDELTVVTNLQATELITNDEGAVTGVKAKNLITDEEMTFDCGAVVLATGGFGANAAMRAEANPEYGDAYKSTDCVGATGDGLTMAKALGADLVDMELIQTYPTCDVDTGALLYLCDMRLDENAIMVNKEGERFVEELDRRDVLSEAILDQTDEKAYMIWDQAGADAVGIFDIYPDEYDNLAARDLIIKGDTIEEVCEPLGVDAAALQETLNTWNSYVDQGSDPDFNYRGEMHKIETAPYYLVVYKPAVHYTMGGLHINTDAQVLDAEGNPIEGLYAAGEVAGHKMGSNRLGSTSMADIYTFGRIAGDNAADYVGVDTETETETTEA